MKKYKCKIYREAAGQGKEETTFEKNEVQTCAMSVAYINKHVYENIQHFSSTVAKLNNNELSLKSNICNHKINRTEVEWQLLSSIIITTRSQIHPLHGLLLCEQQ